MKHPTTLKDREEIVALKVGGASHRAVATKTGWHIDTVRKVWRQYRRQGDKGLQTGAIGRPRRGALSTYPGLVRYVALRLKVTRPHAGSDVILADMALRPSLRGQRLPSSASLSAYFQQFGERLVQPRAHHQLPGQHAQLAPVQGVHECWQLDFDEKLHWRGVGWVNLMSLVDTYSGIKLGSYLTDAGAPAHFHLMSWPAIQSHLRQAFVRWGLPMRLRTDHDRRLVAEGDYPFPMPFTLWLVGLGIQHELILRVTQNGVVERSHRTWEARMLDIDPGPTLRLAQDYVNYELWRMNAVLPSRSRRCHRRPPLLVYPEVRTTHRPYQLADELALFSLARVHAYLAQGRWLRRTSAKGQFHFNAEMYSVGTAYGQQTVVVTFDPNTHAFQVVPSQDNTLLLTFSPAWLSTSAITGLF